MRQTILKPAASRPANGRPTRAERDQGPSPVPTRCERWLSICAATISILGTLMLGLGERVVWLPLLMAAVAFSSVYFTDLKRWFVLNNTWERILAPVVMLAALWNFPFAERDVQLLLLADLLVYLQCILLYRQKSPRVYRYIFTLSLLQVAVACVINLGAVFGVLLAVYLFAALATLFVFVLYQEQFALQPSAEGLRQSAAPSSTKKSAATSTGAGRARPSNGAARGQHPTGRLTFLAPPERAPRDETLSGLPTQIFKLGTITLLLVPLAFLVIPRADRGQAGWQGTAMVGAQHLVGFSEYVTLGELGEIIESPQEVMRVRFLDAKTGRIYPLKETPLIRGTALTQYENGEWHKETVFVAPPGGMRATDPPDFDPRDRVLQEITVEPLGNTDALFAVYPIFSPERNPDLDYDPILERLTRSRPMQSKSFSYNLVTTAFDGGRQTTIRLHPRTRINDLQLQMLLLLPPTKITGQDPLAGLKALASQVCSGLPDDDPIRKARALEQFLRDSGRFTYTLRPPVRETDMDPIEDFVTRHPQGHCEYFASALTLMLRSVGIPARMVLGFKGGDWNEMGQFYQVRQLHAHAWVEALIRPQYLPPDVPRPEGRFSSGGWLTLDPTPGSPLPPEAPTWHRIRTALNYSEYLWARYVLGLNSRVQQEDIYSPLASGAESLFDTAAWRSSWDGFKAFLRGEATSINWISWRGGLAAILVQLLLLALYKVGVRIWRRLYRQTRAGPDEKRPPPAVLFYQRLEAALRPLGLERGRSQTQAEFAIVAGGVLADSPQTLALASMPRRVAEAFYRVRFGRRTLDDHEAQAVEQAVTQLESAVASHSNGRND